MPTNSSAMDQLRTQVKSFWDVGQALAWIKRNLIPLSAGSVIAAYLSAALQALLPYFVLSKDAEGTTAANTIRFTGQLKDLGGTNLSEQRLAHVWVSTADKGAPGGGHTAAIGTKGIIITTLVANTDYIILTDATGAFELDVTIAGVATLWVMAEVISKPTSLSGTWA